MIASVAILVAYFAVWAVVHSLLANHHSSKAPF